MSGFVLWFTGLSGAGKTTIANIVEPELERRGFVVDHLDGDIVRTHLSKGLGFSKEDRDTNIARIGWVASRLARAGAVVIVSAISPYEEMRRHARSLVEQHAPFVEIYVATPLEECARRDPKGLYAAAFAGEIDEFTGVSAPYEEPLEPGAAARDDRPHADRVGRRRARAARGAQPRSRAAEVERAEHLARSTLTHLERLEAEAIDIMREVVAEAENPVHALLDREGQLGDAAPGARRRSAPAPPPFPFLHVDTTWKFQDMYAFRDADGRRSTGSSCSCTSTRRASRAGINPFDSGSRRAHRRDEDARRSSRRSTSTASTRPSAARGATRRSRARRSASSPSARRSTAGTRRTSGPSCGGSTTRATAAASRSASSRSRTGPSSTSGSTSTARRSRSCRSTSPPSGRSSSATGR